MSTNTKEIIFHNLVESGLGLNTGTGNLIKVTLHPGVRAFASINAPGEAVFRTRSQVRKHAQKLAKLMCS